MSRTDQQLRAAIERVLPGVRADLESLVRIPGIAFDQFDHTEVERSATFVAALLRGCGLEVRTVRSGGQPAVIGLRPAPPGAPTVLLYAHHDVQPAGDPALWTSDPFEPAERVLGIDAPATGDPPDALTPRAAAKISVRVPPGVDPVEAYAALRSHLERHAPWGARVAVTPAGLGAPCRLDATGPACDAARSAITAAWDGTPPVLVGIGGSVPCVVVFQRRYPDAVILVTGIEDPYCAAHGPDESLHLGEFARTCLAEALLLRNLGV